MDGIRPARWPQLPWRSQSETYGFLLYNFAPPGLLPPGASTESASDCFSAECTARPDLLRSPPRVFDPTSLRPLRLFSAIPAVKSFFPSSRKRVVRGPAFLRDPPCPLWLSSQIDSP